MIGFKALIEGMLKSNISEEKHLAQFVVDLLEDEPERYELVAASMEVFIDMAVLIMRTADKEK